MKKVFLMRSKSLGVLAALFLLTPSLAFADTLVLKSTPTDGETIAG